MLLMVSGLNFDKGKNRAILYIYHFALNLALSLQALASANRAAAAPLKTRIERHIDEHGFAVEVELVVDSDDEE